MRLLIVNADDFGLNDAATEGIIESYLAGSVTSTTLMVNAPATERAASLAIEHTGIGVGLHFNLTWGRPLSVPRDVPALVGPDGRFLGRPELGRKLLTGRVPQAQVRLELRAQLDRMAQLGLRPTHIDSHQHVHGFNAVFSPVAEYCSEAGIPMRVPWVATTGGGGIRRRARRALLAAMLARATAPWRGRVRWNDGLGSVFDLGVEPVELTDDHYRRVLQLSSGEVFELMVHPVTSGAAMQGYTGIGEVGEAEWQYLRAGGLREVAREAGFRMGSYRDVAA